MRTCSAIRVLFIFLITIQYLSAAIVAAATINVPDDEPTIQDGIKAADSGVDEVVVAPGTYTELLDLQGKEIVLRSTNPNDPGVVAATISDANNAGLAISNVGGTETLISGFTIINGLANLGGAISLQNDQLTITHCTFQNNDGVTCGGAIYQSGSQLHITDCTFVSNLATIAGGAIHSTGMLIAENGMFTSNQVPGSTANAVTEIGGAIYSSGDSLTLTDCDFQGNSAFEVDINSCFVLLFI